jgi:hypothetical protein
MNLTRFLLMVIFGLLLGVVYYDLDTGDFGGVNSKLSVIFLAMSFPSSICAGSALPTFFRQRAVYYRETTVGLYGPNIFHRANFLTEMPYIVACVFVFLCPFYYMSTHKRTHSRSHVRSLSTRVLPEHQRFSCLPSAVLMIACVCFQLASSTTLASSSSSGSWRS